MSEGKTSTYSPLKHQNVWRSLRHVENIYYKEHQFSNCVRGRVVHGAALLFSSLLCCVGSNPGEVKFFYKEQLILKTRAEYFVKIKNTLILVLAVLRTNTHFL